MRLCSKVMLTPASKQISMSLSVFLTNIYFSNVFQVVSCAVVFLKCIVVWASHHSSCYTSNSAETCSMTAKECEPVDSDIEDTLFTVDPLIRSVWAMTLGEDMARTSSGQGTEGRKGQDPWFWSIGIRQETNILRLIHVVHTNTEEGIHLLTYVWTATWSVLFPKPDLTMDSGCKHWFWPWYPQSTLEPQKYMAVAPRG